METDGRNDTAPVTDPSGTVVFDTSSGISLEEQQEILESINAMSGGNRLAPEAAVTKAKKKGFLFPLFVNVAALILLAGGFFLLTLFHGQDEQEIRESSATLGLTERKLIQEIRQETSRRLKEKENEISDILSKLSAVDAEYQALYSSVETLTEAQKERASYLLAMQAEYHSSLSGLEDEKDRILEDSRQREASLRTQAEERAGELSLQLDQSQASLGEAIEELGRLGAEQERVAGAEAQMGAFYAAVNNRIGAGRTDEASLTLLAMKEFLNAPSLRGIRSFEARKATHMAAIGAMEEAVEEVRRLGEEAKALEREAAQAREAAAQARETAAQAGSAAQVLPPPVTAAEDNALTEAYAALQARFSALENRAADQEKIIAAYSSQGSEQGRMIAGFEASISELRTENEALSSRNISQQQTLGRRDAENVALRQENESQRQQMAELNTTLSNLRGQQQTTSSRLSESEAAVAALRTQLQTANAAAQQTQAALAEQAQQNTSLTQQNAELQQRYDDLQRRMDAAVRAFSGQ